MFSVWHCSIFFCQNSQIILVMNTFLKALKGIFVIFAKTVMIWQYNKMHISCVKVHCLWVHPVALIWFARIHRSWVNTTTQGQGACLRGVNHSRTHAADSPPSSCRVDWVVPLPHAGAVSALNWSYTSMPTVNYGWEQRTTTEPKNAPPLPMSKRRNKKTDEEEQCKKKKLDRAREKTRINAGASFQNLLLSCWTKDPSWYMFHSMY